MTVARRLLKLGSTLVLILCAALGGTPREAIASYSSEITAVRQLPKRESRPELFEVYGADDPDFVAYALHVDSSGHPAPVPISVSWIRPSQGGRAEPLDFAEERFGYGVKTKFLDADTFELRVNGYPERVVTVRKTRNGQWRPFLDVAGRPAELFFAVLTFDRSGLMARVTSADIYVRDLATQKLLRERIRLS